jgi:predicted metal-dependent hydrolase
VKLCGLKTIPRHAGPTISKEAMANLLKVWYRQQLKALLPALIEKWEKSIGVDCSDWGVRQIRTKWRACNVDAKRIWLNLELAKKPVICLEYIVVHELVHL